MTESKSVLLTGATGYVGGRLLPLLESDGYSVRCLARRPEYLAFRVADQTEVVDGDVLNPESLKKAMDGIDTAFYLVHSMGSSGSFEAEDREGARNFAAAAAKAGVRRIIYLGGLGDVEDDLSPHLSSRHEVGDILRESGCNVIEFRASIVIGSGSLSFELVRSLVRRLPIMICPKWVHAKAQPIAIEDLLEYLLAAIDYRSEQSRVFEIGGPEQVSYGDIMNEYAKQCGLRRYMISVPVLTPRLSSLWLGLVTPVYARIGRKLVDSLKNSTVVQDKTALEEFAVRPRGLEEAIRRARIHEEQELADTRWSDALSSGRGIINWGGVRLGNRILDSRQVSVAAGPQSAFKPVRQIGGERGWYYANFLWMIRGWIDLLVGGVGMRRARRDPDELHVGEVLDWWRVEKYDPNHLLRLTAEMKVPGRAWLEFEVTPKGEGSAIRQTAIFDPAGFLGLAYWYSLYPLHAIIFRGMLHRIAAEAERVANSAEAASKASTAPSGTSEGPATTPAATR